MRTGYLFRAWVAFLLAFVPFAGAQAGTNGKVSGTVLDPQGAAVVKAKVSIVNTDTNLRFSTLTDSAGLYSFRDLPVGIYNLEVAADGFKTYRRFGIQLDASSSIMADTRLVVGGATSVVTVTQTPVSVATPDTQLGEVIGGKNILAVPLNGRSFTDLLALQPGVAPQTTITGTSIQAAGASIISPSGYLNAGTISVNGQREYTNGFTVNDADVVERFTMGAAAIPNLDAIAEFRILTGNFDAEYGNYSGGRINVVTKTGNNQIHGSGFEFLRNTALDAKNYFSERRGIYQQNQFGGTAGGPVARNKAFFFADYQGTHLKKGVDTSLGTVPSLLNREGNLSDLASLLTGKVNGQYWADQLSKQLGYPVHAGEPYYFPSCTVGQCVLPGAKIPQSAWSGPAKHLMQYIPKPNSRDNGFTTSSENLILHDSKGAIRLDGNTRYGLLSAYYFIDDYDSDNPFPTQQGGANVPGFNALNFGRAQLLTLGDTKSFGSNNVNEFHFSFVRDVNILGTPVGGVGPTLKGQGFVTAQGTQSIVPNRPKIQGVENIVFDNFVMGLTITGLDQTDNTFEFRDSFSRLAGKHAFTYGGEFLYSQVNAYANVQSNGTFLFFNGTETGSGFANFLLGIPSRYTQGDAQAFYNRNKYGALFLQDSWRANSQLTFNYGLRWDVIMPWYEKYNQIQTIVPGQQSVVFPGAPKGLVFPGDPGIPRALAPTRWNNLSPRFGLAYSPESRDGVLGKIFGGPSHTSIRAGFGRFFSAVEGVSAGVMAGDAPYGQTYTSPGSPLFSNPFITAASGFDNGQRFPLQYPPLNASASNPNNRVDWSNYLPINGLPGYDPRNMSPYSLQYTVSVQRQIGSNSLLTMAYVGSVAHHLLLLVEANPGNPALCLALSQSTQVAPNSTTCGPYQESNAFTTASGKVYNGTRDILGSNFGSVDWLSTIGNSNFNALELTFRHTSRHAEFLAGYTYGKSLDNSSSISDQLVPGNPRLTYGLSSFDLAHNLVFSYHYELPFDRLFGARNRFTQGWTISGITRFATGFPVTFINNTDRSLLGTQPDGVNSLGADLPQMTAGDLHLNSNPRNGNSYFNTTLIGPQPLGTPGNVPRRFFHGPGMQNWDIALLKDTRLTESSAIQFRLEAFNAFNHAQFFGPNAVNGVILDPQFGQVVNAAPPRLAQVALKLSF